MFIFNPEIKKFTIKYILLLFLALLLSVGFSVASINVIKNKVVENNQVIVGNILSEHPELEKEIIDIITQGKNYENIELGAKVLSKYNYNHNIKSQYEPIINSSFKDITKTNIILVLLIFLVIIILALFYFRRIYKDIIDMTNYVYNSSEGIEFDMKNRNQEGQIGLLKTELIKMTTVLKENVSLLKGEKVFLNNTISDISHQLRTPMTSLMILNDLMYDDLPIEVKVEFLDKIKSQLNRMDWLIKSMLKLSKVEAKVIDFKNDKVNIEELIHRAVQPIKVPIEIKNQNLVIEGDKNASYIGDIDWSVEALVNIIKNCVEHTNDNGTISISFEENPLYSEIIVKDSGEGIDKKDIPNIFKRFYRGKSSSKEDSVGIGLAMAKSIIESQNGDIFVRSEKSKGTEFHITFHKTYCD
ncbi:sensor histidine kinase [Romboutsia weinsteinii]|uniref:histidine kinase n=1 Tax=Romboutsia weinsteinii TaxID=2020949 RepID=A0A371J9I4_9FIRM|nr:HAMP domain-containing sensor histidine kinase [Romboutsia weinsteinii]RDY29430.1 sensor histidine kinase [Romboutsia weinsteinii]